VEAGKKAIRIEKSFFPPLRKPGEQRGRQFGNIISSVSSSQKTALAEVIHKRMIGRGGEKIGRNWDTHCKETRKAQLAFFSTQPGKELWGPS